jgi:hypothetical protein
MSLIGSNGFCFILHITFCSILFFDQLVFELHVSRTSTWILCICWVDILILRKQNIT